MDSEIRFEGALKFTAIWLESFLIFSMFWSFHPVLSEAGRAELDERVLEKYLLAKTEYSAYQKEKKRRLAEKTKEQKSQKTSDKGGASKSGMSRSGTKK
jgi:hypothetical protein